MRYIANFSHLEEAAKKAKPSDIITVLTDQDSIPIANLNTLMSLKAKVEVVEIKDETDTMALIGYYVGKEGKNITVMTDTKIPEVLLSLMTPVKRKPAAASQKTKTTKTASDKVQKEPAAFPMNSPVSVVEKVVPGDKAEHIVKDKPKDEKPKKRLKKDEMAIIEEIANEKGEKKDTARKHLVSCFTFEDEPESEGAKKAVMAAYSEAVWEKIEPIRQQLWEAANQ